MTPSQFLPGITIRACEHGDLDKVLKIEKACFRYPYPRSEFLYYLASARRGFILACEGAVPIGYIIATYSWGRGRIVSIAVSPDHQRRGVGRKLMGAATSHLADNGVKTVVLEVRAGDKGPIDFYRELFFRETGEIKRRYYPDGEDAIVMSCELQDQ